MQVHTIDLRHLGCPGRIAAYLVTGPTGPILVETGPASCHHALLSGLAGHGFAPSDIRDVFVTHIHLDHAGGAGWWARQGATVHVHEAGASHLIAPEKLIASATRLYGKRMNVLWGKVLSAPESGVRIISDGEIVTAGGLAVEALETPGHASHHHVYRIDDIAFVGDLAGIVVPGTGLVELPTVPPEYDLERWLQSLTRLLDAQPAIIYPTHFGPVGDVERHISTVERLLTEITGFIRSRLEDGASRQEIEDAFGQWNRRRLVAAGASSGQLRGLSDFNPPAVSVAGLLRYWKKKSRLVPRQ